MTLFGILCSFAAILNVISALPTTSIFFTSSGQFFKFCFLDRVCDYSLLSTVPIHPALSELIGQLCEIAVMGNVLYFWV